MRWQLFEFEAKSLLFAQAVIGIGVHVEGIQICHMAH